jgi:hypothetical protein
VVGQPVVPNPASLLNARRGIRADYCQIIANILAGLLAPRADAVARDGPGMVWSVALSYRRVPIGQHSGTRDMPQFKLEGGSFGTGQASFDGSGFSLPSGRAFHPTRIPASEIISAELASAENIKKISGTLGWGAAGLVALGPLGMFAGLLAGGRKNVATFVVFLRDGRQFIGTGDNKTWVAIMSAAVTAAARRPAVPNSKPTLAPSESPSNAVTVSNGKPQEVLINACKTWGWTVRSQAKPEFRRFDVFSCHQGDRTVAVAVTDDPVTDYSFGQMADALHRVESADQRYFVARSVGQSIQRDIKKSGIGFIEVAEIGRTVAEW